MKPKEEHNTESASKKDSLIETKWATYTGIGTFALYFLGYLVLRFQLSAYGIETDLAVLDERYFFAGAQFLVYFVAAIPICLLVLMPLIALGYPLRTRLNRYFGHWLEKPNRVLVIGILFSVFLIQFVERQCLPFTNLLLRDELPPPRWLDRILLDPTGGIESLYFCALVLACAVSALLCWLAWKKRSEASRLGISLLAVLSLTAMLLLPVNFGILIAGKELPRVASLNGKEPLRNGETAWRIWEGKETTTFLLQSGESRKMVVLDRKEITRGEIVQYDLLLRLLFGGRP